MKHLQLPRGASSVVRAGIGCGVAAACLLGVGTPVVAQERWPVQVEIDVGGLYSSALLDVDIPFPTDDGRTRLETASLGAGLQPTVAVSVLLDPSWYRSCCQGWEVEVRARFATGTADGEGPAGTWSAGRLNTVEGSAGVRFAPIDALTFRAELGHTFFLSGSGAAFEDGVESGIMVGGGALVRLTGLPVHLWGGAQRHPVGSAAIRAAGGVDGAVWRVLAGIGVRLGDGTGSPGR